MRLDLKTCPIGTVGFFAPYLLSEFDGNDSDPFEWFREPAVVLNQSREWMSLKDHQPGKVHAEGSEVFADWKSAVKHTIEQQLRQVERLRNEANELNEEALKVTRWLAEHGN